MQPRSWNGLSAILTLPLGAFGLLHQSQSLFLDSALLSPVRSPAAPSTGRLEANQTLEGAGGSITSVDFDPSVRGMEALGPEGTSWV